MRNSPKLGLYATSSRKTVGVQKSGDTLLLGERGKDAQWYQLNQAFYLSCTKKYPKDYLLGALMHIMGLPNRAIRTTRARLFTNIITNSVYNTHDHSWD